MPLYEITAPNGRTYRIEGPEGATQEQIIAEVTRQNPFAAVPGPAKRKEDTTGFTAAVSAGFERLKGEGALSLGKLGVMGTAEAEAYQKAREEAARKRFTPTQEWSLTKLAELAGGSLPYMVAPVAAGLAAASTPVTGALGLGALGAGLLGAGTAGAVSAAQFTGSNLAAQMDTGKTLEQTSGTDAVLAAIPQAALDVGSTLLMPGIGRMLGRTGKQVTEEMAAKLAQQTFARKVADYAVATGKSATVEGVTEATQQVLERLQAGKELTDPEARGEYLENFIGGAALASVLGPFGRAAERGRIAGEGRRLTAEREQREYAEQTRLELEQAPQRLSELEAAQAQLKASLAQTADPLAIQELAQQGMSQAKEINRLRSILEMPELQEAGADEKQQKRIEKLQTQLANAQRQGNFNAAAKLIEKLNELQATPISPVEAAKAPAEEAPAQVSEPAPFVAPDVAVAPEVTAPEAELTEPPQPTVRQRRAKGAAAQEPVVPEAPAAVVPEAPAAVVPEAPAAVVPEAPQVVPPVTETPEAPQARAPLPPPPPVADVGSMEEYFKQIAPSPEPPTAKPVQQGTLFTAPPEPKLTPARAQAIEFWEANNDGKALHIPFERLSEKRQNTWIRDTELGRASADTHARAVRLQLEEDRKYGPAGPKISSEFGGPSFEPANAVVQRKGIQNLLELAQRSDKLSDADKTVVSQIDAYLPDILATAPETRTVKPVGEAEIQRPVNLRGDVYTWLRDTLAGRDRADLGANIVSELRNVAAAKQSELLPTVEYVDKPLTPKQAELLQGTDLALRTGARPVSQQAAEDRRTTPMPEVVPVEPEKAKTAVQQELFEAPERETAYATKEEFKKYLAGDALDQLRKTTLTLGEKTPPTGARVQQELAPIKSELDQLEGLLTGLSSQKKLIEAGGEAAAQRLSGARAALKSRQNSVEDAILGRVRRLVTMERSLAAQIKEARAQASAVNRWVGTNATIFDYNLSAGKATDADVQKYLVESARLEDKLQAWDAYAKELAANRSAVLNSISTRLNNAKNKPFVTKLREEVATIKQQMAELDKIRREQAARSAENVAAAAAILRAPKAKAAALRTQIETKETELRTRGTEKARAANAVQRLGEEETAAAARAAADQERALLRKALNQRSALPGIRVDAKKARETLNRMDDLVVLATSSRLEAEEREVARNQLARLFGEDAASKLMTAWAKASRPNTEERAQIDAAKEAADSAALNELKGSILERMDADRATYESLKREIIEGSYKVKGAKASAGAVKHARDLADRKEQLAEIEQELETGINSVSGKKLNKAQIEGRQKKREKLPILIDALTKKVEQREAARTKARNIKITKLEPAVSETTPTPTQVQDVLSRFSPDEYLAIKEAPDYDTFVENNPDMKINKTIFSIAKTQIGRQAAPLVREATIPSKSTRTGVPERTEAATGGGKTVRVKQARASTGRRAISKADEDLANKIAKEFGERDDTNIERLEEERAQFAKEGFEEEADDSVFVSIDEVEDFLEAAGPDVYDALKTGYAERATNELDAETTTDLERGDTIAALEKLAENGSSDFVRALARRLANTLEGVRTKLVDGLEVDGVVADGAYSASRRLIELNSNLLSEEAFTHEATHAATIDAINAYEKGGDLTAEQRKAAEELDAIFSKLQKDERLADEYGVTSLKEFAAEIMANADFRNRIDALPQSLLRRIYNAFLRLIGLNPKTVSEASVEQVYALFAPASGTGSRQGSAVRTSNATAREYRTPLGFYSALANSIGNIQTNAAPAAGWKDAIKGLINKGAVKADEVEWTGINDWLDLQQGKVTKAQVQEYLKAGGVQVEETLLGAPLGATRQKPEGRALLAQRYDAAVDAAMDADVSTNPTYIQSLPEDQRSPEEQAVLDAWNAVSENPNESILYGGGLPTKYDQYVLPGGENYREVLLTLPMKSKETWMVFDPETGESRPARVNSRAGALDEADGDFSRILAVDDEYAKNYKSSHWDQPNVLAHIRVNDRTDADGNRVLFVEEIQSDWGQEGKKQGFSNTKLNMKNPVVVFNARTGENVARFRTGAAAEAYIAEQDPSMATLDYEDTTARGGIEKGLVPAAPFVTKTEGWLNLALKRIVTMAAEGGYDKVAFVNGAQSADRYDLSKQVSRVAWNKEKSILGAQRAAPDTGMRKYENVTEEKLADYIGKEAAQRLIEAKEYGGWRIIDGGDLKVGGEGMRAFYDKIVPTALKKLLPKVGGGQIEAKPQDYVPVIQKADGWYVQHTDPKILTGPYQSKEEAQTVRVSDVTAAMREKVGEGLPLFSLAREERVASVMRGKFFNNGPKFAAGVPQDVTEATNSMVARRAGLGDRAVAAASGLLWRTKALDRWAPMEALIKMGVAKGKITEAQALQARIYMRMLEQRSQLVGTAVVDGVPQVSTSDKYGGIRLVEGRAGANLRQLLDALKESGVGDSRATEEMFTSWMAVLRAEKEGIGFAKLNYDLNPAEAAKIKAYVDSTPKVKDAFEKGRQIYKEYNRDLLTLLVDSGVMERSKMNELMQGDFVPFYRVNDSGMVRLELTPTKTFDIGNLIDQPELKELVGGNQKILPIFDGAVRNTAILMNMATSNLQTREVAYTLQALGLGHIRSKEGKPFSPRFKQGGAIYHIALDPDAFPKDIPSTLLVEGLKGITASMPAMVKLMGVPANFLRTWVMRTPVYPVRQVIRDSAHAWLTTGGDFAPVLSSIAAFGKMVSGTSQTEPLLQRSGVISSNVYTGDTRDYIKLLKDMRVGDNKFGSVLAKLDAIAQQGDAATRAVVYEKFRASGMSHPEALLNTLESMNFSRRGTSSSLHWLSTMIPFFQSSVQGLDAVYRAFKGDTSFNQKMDARAKLFKRGFLVSVATMVYASMMQDDEAYKNATPDQRLMNWFVRVPGLDEPIRVPIPFELGLIFKSIPEAFINTAFGDTKASDALKALGQQAMRSMPGGEFPLPTAIKPVLEVAMNHSLFNDAPIESRREQGMDVAERYRTNTTELAKALGQFGVLSPVQIEHLIRGYTGNLFLHMASLAEVLFRPALPEGPERPARNLSEMPLIGSMFQPNTARGVIDATYKEVERAQQAKASYDRLLEEGRDEEAARFADRFAMRIALNSTGGSYRQQMGEFAKYKRQIATSDLSPAEKRDQINEIKRLEIDYSKQIREIFSEAE